MITLRPYQEEAKTAVYAEWAAGANVVACVLPTGAGKTVLLANIIHEHTGAACIVAHRQELVMQISVALAREQVLHRLIAPAKVIKLIIAKQMRECGRSFFDPSSPVAVAGVDTLVRRDLGGWAQQVTLWIQDECHHILRENKWGKAASLFPNARGLGVTATPCRADGKGLGSHADGLIDEMVTGPTMRELIDMGNLCDYRIIAPPNDIQLDNVEISTATGDYSKVQLTKAVKASHIVGDVVEHYKKFANGKRGVTFCTDVSTATEIAIKYTENGVPAEVVHAKTPDDVRQNCVDRLSRGELLQLVNVDLFGEGFDLPCIEVCSFARPTQSYSLFVQQFGRALRLLEGKDKAIIIDHVGNVVRHGLPDADREWSLERRTKRGKKKGADEIPMTSCTECFSVYELIHKECPFCGNVPVPDGRSAPEMVQGDLVELDAETLAAMRSAASDLIGGAKVPQHLPMHAQAGARNRHEERKQMQLSLRASIDQWMGYRAAENLNQSQSQRLFFIRFGIDVLSAQSFGRPDAHELAQRVSLDLGRSHTAYVERVTSCV